MKVCNFCNQANEDSANFCGKCGRHFLSAQSVAHTNRTPCLQRLTSKQIVLGTLVIVAVVTVLGLLTEMVPSTHHPERQERQARQQKLIAERNAFVESSQLCTALKALGKCAYSGVESASLIIYLSKVKPQFHHAVMNDLLRSKDLVPKVRDAGFDKIKFVYGWDSEIYDLTTEPPSKEE